MLQTFFELHGKKYKIKYQKVDTSNGELYQGMVFSDNIIGFSYVKANDESFIFDNEFLDKQYRDLIVDVIEKKEKHLNKKSWWYYHIRYPTHKSSKASHSFSHCIISASMQKASIISNAIETSFHDPVTTLSTVQVKNPQIIPSVIE